MNTQSNRRNVVLLAICQGLYLSASAIGLALTGIVSYSLVDNKTLATLPFALITVAAAATTIPVSLLMARKGRRMGFMIGAVAGLVGGLISTWAIFKASFLAFSIGNMAIGIFQGCAQYYRLAAADVADPEFKSRAISLVLVGGVAAALMGPALAAWCKDLFAPVTFAGSYAAVSVLACASLLVLSWLDIPKQTLNVADGGRPLLTIAQQPIFIAAVANCTIGYAAMMFVMTATPLAAIACNHSVTEAASIIQWHLVGMFAPAFLTGTLIARFGIAPVLLAGAILLTAGVAVAVNGITITHFWIALALNGVGWNFMYVGGSTLLTSAYTVEERAKTQAANEFLTFSIVALAQLAAGGVFAWFSWNVINYTVVPCLALAVLLTLWWYGLQRSQRFPRGA